MFLYILGCYTYENDFSRDNDRDGFSVYDGDCDDKDASLNLSDFDNDGFPDLVGIGKSGCHVGNCGGSKLVLRRGINGHPLLGLSEISYGEVIGK